MNVTISPSDSAISCRTAFSRSSNSPRYFAPATIEPRSSATTRLSLQRLGDVARDDPLREALDDRGLPDAGLADQHGVVLRAAGQHLDHAPDLVVAADHGVELAAAREVGEVAAVALEDLVLLLGVRVGDALTAADLRERGEDRVPLEPRLAQDRRRAGDALEQREQQVLGATRTRR